MELTAEQIHGRKLNINQRIMEMSVYGTFMDIKAALATIDEEDEIEESEVSSSILFYLIILEDIRPFVGPLISLFWTSDDVCPRF